ncbi:hypothetical protein P170DRAFT_437509 [Aspergillus steynii IBT 23096]|uniref:Uncharacterized protein n=1 Tax=Aspergillus steynii IBT 23096 TaxID=1392250 RepID=A0A2I2G4G9_9EURO|nr:uncharacterized protein P170DRAFT_437509 [Aspergillus steynii IBT 23096]PLB47771.1 hypothetical protein P170DRAFT_437509 [Aspergillus steynii IBT 23096]
MPATSMSYAPQTVYAPFRPESSGYHVSQTGRGTAKRPSMEAEIKQLDFLFPGIPAFCSRACCRFVWTVISLHPCDLLPVFFPLSYIPIILEILRSIIVVAHRR